MEVLFLGRWQPRRRQKCNEWRPAPRQPLCKKQLGRRTQIGRGKTKTGPNTRTASQNGGLTRVDMIAAVLRHHPRRTVRELIALLDQEYSWKDHRERSDRPSLHAPR